MKKQVLTLAALAAIGFAGAAYAGDSTAPKAMSDSEMDKVTAGATPDPTGRLELWAFGYSVSAGNHTFVNTVPKQADSGFKGNGWGSACLNFVGCGR
jgi:hypothetical protein